MGLKLKIPPVCEPIDVDEAKAHLRVDGTGEDRFIKRAIEAARQIAEYDTNRQLVVATHELVLPQFYSTMYLPKPPLVEVSSITYVDSAGNTQTLATANYDVHTDELVAYIRCAYGYTWPTTRGVKNAVTITFISGYAAKFTANISTDVVTVEGREYDDSDVVQLWNSGAEVETLPAGLDEGTIYYVRDAVDDTMKLSLTDGGSAVDITDAKSDEGIHFIGRVPKNIINAMMWLISHMYENRELEVLGNTSLLKYGPRRALRKSKVYIPGNG